ncbi:GNAT family N-acetyltransferase [Nocardioides caldifontis]|uniref:GNAT family N-acetyltransferase n=1 Tax=Nocardioides caldifontis TaxID=2588938 RepID=UPI001EEFCFE0|nr:GNAT family N-acetyltransferase [Nocardioides caldifontis]
MSSTDRRLVLRPAEPDDADEVAGVYLAARRAAAASGAMPPPVHPDHEVRAWLAARTAADETWVAEQDGAVVGYARFTAEWLDDLYVHPDHAGGGVGSALLELVRGLRPGGFGLWVFESNAGARRFYRRHGLVEVERTDGSGNEERAPDVRMVWPDPA